jgi:hypothetical protein
MELASVEKKVEMIDTWEEEERIATERRSLCQIQCQKPNDRGLAKRWLWPVVETEVFIFAAERTLARRRSRTLQWPMHGWQWQYGVVLKRDALSGARLGTVRYRSKQRGHGLRPIRTFALMDEGRRTTDDGTSPLVAQQQSSTLPVPGLPTCTHPQYEEVSTGFEPLHKVLERVPRECDFVSIVYAHMPAAIAALPSLLSLPCSRTRVSYSRRKS